MICIQQIKCAQLADLLLDLSLRMMQPSDQLKGGYGLVGQWGWRRLGVCCMRWVGEDVYMHFPVLLPQFFL